MLRAQEKEHGRGCLGRACWSLSSNGGVRGCEVGPAAHIHMPLYACHGHCPCISIARACLGPPSYIWGYLRALAMMDRVWSSTFPIHASRARNAASASSSFPRCLLFVIF